MAADDPEVAAAGGTAAAVAVLRRPVHRAADEQFSPPDSVNQATPEKAQTFILQVLKGEKLL